MSAVAHAGNGCALSLPTLPDCAEYSPHCVVEFSAGWPPLSGLAAVFGAVGRRGCGGDETKMAVEVCSSSCSSCSGAAGTFAMASSSTGKRSKETRFMMGVTLPALLAPSTSFGDSATTTGALAASSRT